MQQEHAIKEIKTASWHWYLLAALCLLGAWLRITGITWSSLILDELSSWSLSHQTSIAEVLTAARRDFHPPGHLLILYIVQKYFGDSELALRMPSLIAGILSTPTIYLLGRKLYNPRVGLIAAALMAASWTGVRYSQEARAYSCVLLLSLVTTYLLLLIFAKFKSAGKIRLSLLVAHVFLSSLLCYLHYFGLYLVFLQGVVALFASRGRRLFWIIGAAYFSMFLLFLPWLPELFFTMKVGGSSSMLRPEPWVFLEYLEFFFNRSQFLGWLFIGAETFFWIRAFRKHEKQNKITWLLIAWILVPFLVIYFQSIWLSPVLTVKNFIICLPAGYVLIAHGLDRVLRDKDRWVSLGTIAVPCVFSLLLIFHVNYYHRRTENWREVSQYVCQNVDAPSSIMATVVTSPSIRPSSQPGRADYMASPELFNYYLGKICPEHTIQYSANSLAEAELAVQNFLDGPDKKLWYIWAHRSHPQIIEYLIKNLSLARQVDFQKSGVLVFVRPGSMPEPIN